MKNPKEIRKESEELRELIQRLRDSLASKPSPFDGLSEEEIINKLKETRYKLWEEKFASRLGR